MEAIDKLRELSKKLEDPYFIKEFEEGFEKFLKERDMKTYHVKTQESYNGLMTELEAEGYTWNEGAFPTSANKFPHYKEKTAITIYPDSKVIKYANIYDVELYTRDKIVEYKVVKVASIECKQCHDKRHHDNAKYCSMCGKKLVDEPKFKVGDYVVQYDNYITKIDEIDEYGYLIGRTYEVDVQTLEIPKNYIVSKTARIAIPEEIAEYEVALTFHKHGRKPFEVKEGDILLEDSDYKFFVDDPENWGKEDFVSGEYTFAKTAEEVKEWIKGE